jgi:hypothetical protein
MMDEKRSTGFWAGVVLGFVLMTPFLYLLVMGPLLYLNLNGTLDDSLYSMAVQPVVLWGYHVGDSPRWLWAPWKSYMAWWGALAGVFP